MINFFMKKLKIFTLLFVCCLSLLTLNAHESTVPSSKAYNSEQLTENIFMLKGKGGNIVLFKGDQGLLLIDDDYKKLSKELKQEIKHFAKLDTLQYLINTHWHGDHTGGNFELGSFTKIVSHINVRKRLQTTQEVKLFNMVSKPYPAKALPSITFNDTLNIYFNGEEISIIHYAYGHTDGDSVIQFKNSNVIHMGDLYFSNMFPFVDVGTGGDVLQLARNIKLVMNKINENTIIVPGHGKISSKKELNEYYLMLVGTYNEVHHLISNGISLEDIKKQGLSSKWEKWNVGFIKENVWISIIHDSILKNRT